MDPTRSHSLSGLLPTKCREGGLSKKACSELQALMGVGLTGKWVSDANLAVTQGLDHRVGLVRRVELDAGVLQVGVNRAL